MEKRWFRGHMTREGNGWVAGGFVVGLLGVPREGGASQKKDGGPVVWVSRAPMSVLFEPFALRGLVLPNRLVLPAMVTRLSGEDGVVNDDLRARFSREARSAANLRHRNIVTIVDVGAHNGPPFIAKENIQGQKLTTLIRAETPP